MKQAGCNCVPFRQRADVYIVHSCAVTARAGVQTRQLLRRAHRTNPRALVVVAGCYAQLDYHRLASEKLATHILGNPDKFGMIEWLSHSGTFEKPIIAVRDGGNHSCTGFEILPVSRMHTGRTRAMLKIQDGCNSFCSYCVVPHVRGRSRSLPPHLVLTQLDELITAGYQEIVLTGIHLGQWGKDLAPSQNLSELLLQMDAHHHPPRLRLSSLEPGEIDSSFISLISSLPWICPHLHVPLQSGDADILDRMHRPYSPGHYADLIARIHAALPDAAIGADVLTGFPGETEKQFQNTLELLNHLPVSYLHVFPFSPRPGTPAAEFSGQIQGRELKRRAGMLHELGRQKRLAFRRRFIGKKLEVLIETEFQPGLWEGLSGNYIRVVVPTADGVTPGSRQMVKISGFRSENLELEGEVLNAVSSEE